jgi:hypothetical protein
MLFCASYVGVVGREIGIFARQHKSAAARLDTRHCEQQLIEILQHLMGMPYPPVTFTRHDEAAIGECTHDEQDRDGRPEREYQPPI